MTSRIGLMVIGVVFVAATAMTATVRDGVDRDAPIQVTAEIMTGDLAAGLTVFEKNVVIVQGAATIRADRVEVYSRSEGKAGKEDSPDRVIAIGSVKFHQDPSPTRREIDATGERGVFDQAADTVTMTGSPKLWQGKNVVEGEEMIFWIGTDKYEVKGQPDKRVKAVFFPQAKATPTPVPTAVR
jgi:lipopolysaccharide export system protein LptA